MIHLFTYGTLMFRPVWSTVVDGAYRQFNATLPGFVRRSIANEDYPAIIPDRLRSTVEGIIYLDIGSEDLQRLDEFEGTIYQRQHVQVRTNDNLYAADTYVLRPEYRHLLSQSDWHPEKFRHTVIQRFLNTYPGFDP